MSCCEGKSFSILGDSISTLTGSNPEGYNIFYEGERMQQTGVSRPEQTWWGRVIGHFHGRLLVNDSWSGSWVSRLPGRPLLFPSGCSDERTGNLGRDGQSPDVILIFMGVNDWGFGGKLHEDSPLGGDPARCSAFDYAYGRMLDKLCAAYPSAEIWCFTLGRTYLASRPGFIAQPSYGEPVPDLFNQVIRQAAAEHGCHVMEMVTPYDTIDGVHPTAAGMAAIADTVIGALSGRSAAKEKKSEPLP